MSDLKKALIKDPDYARSWKANLAMTLYDDSRRMDSPFLPLPIDQCNRSADRIMEHFFEVDTSSL